MMRSIGTSLGLISVVIFLFLLQVKTSEPHSDRGSTPISTQNHVVRVSWYGEQFHGRTMANGKKFNMHDPTTVAHKKLPLGTHVLFENPATGKKIRAVVRDRGPYIGTREFDLSHAAAERLGVRKAGIAYVHVRIIKTP